MYDIVIIGAGVVGGMIARELSFHKLGICLIEKENDVATGATKANSAIVHAGFDAKVGTLKARLNVRGSEMMEQIATDLGVRYKRNGSLVVGFNEEDETTLRSLLDRGNANGVKGLKLLTREETVALEPNIGKEVTCALHAPTGAIVCPYDLAVAAIGNAMDNGVELKCNFEAVKIESRGEYYAVKSENGEILAKYIINCAGAYSDGVAKMVGDDSFSVHPRRGEYVLLDKNCGGIVSHTVFVTPSKMGKGILVSPTVDGNLLLGPTAVDGEDKEDKAVCPEFFASIFGIAERSVYGIPKNKTITSFCGLRSVGSTGDFIINSPLPRYINVAGIESPGLSASPAIAEYVVQLLRDSGLNLERKESPVTKRRSMHYFRDADRKTKNKIIKENPAYGKIICRCEGVTEGEILDAIRINPRATDLDGVKRRTRAQMGRCQGGFCSPYILDLLSRELGIPYEKVTKNGGDSYIVIGKTKEEKL
ncbi:MAG: NAD(P)/FAD-dependent oxidoreductase [Clostridia bacterium]|nr:NAD(P)/FAD-dependent oxidoreductase [Clostridia bacterium]